MSKQNRKITRKIDILLWAGDEMERIRQEQEAWERKFSAMSDEEQRAWLLKIDTKGEA